MAILQTDSPSAIRRLIFSKSPFEPPFDSLAHPPLILSWASLHMIAAELKSRVDHLYRRVRCRDACFQPV